MPGPDSTLYLKHRVLWIAICVLTVLSATPCKNILFAQQSTGFITTKGSPAPNGYVLGPGDVVSIWALGMDEISGKSFTISPNGNLDLPMVGRLVASGKTLDQLKADLTEKMKFYVREPEVSITIVDLKSQPVSVLGSVKQPGLHQLQGGKSLLEVLSLAGGVNPDASTSAIITRRVEWGPIPVPGSTKDPTGNYYIAKVNLTDVAEARNPQYNIQICPDDVIQVPRARLIYVMGQVGKPGGYVLNDNESVSALQALSMAGGPNQFGALRNARILRVVAGSPDRKQIAVNLARIMEGKSNDSVLRPDDILYIPGNMAKNVSVRAIESGIQIGTGLLIWR